MLFRWILQRPVPSAALIFLRRFSGGGSVHSHSNRGWKWTVPVRELRTHGIRRRIKGMADPVWSSAAASS